MSTSWHFAQNVILALRTLVVNLAQLSPLTLQMVIEMAIVNFCNVTCIVLSTSMSETSMSCWAPLCRRPLCRVEHLYVGDLYVVLSTSMSETTAPIWEMNLTVMSRKVGREPVTLLRCAGECFSHSATVNRIIIKSTLYLTLLACFVSDY